MNNDIIDEIMKLLPRRSRRNDGDSSRARIMHRLDKEGPLSPSALRDGLGVTGPRITAVLNELEERGLIHRESDLTDRRSVSVSLTETGRQEVYRRKEQRRRKIEQLTERIGPDDTQALLRILRTANELFQSHPE